MQKEFEEFLKLRIGLKYAAEGNVGNRTVTSFLISWIRRANNFMRRQARNAANLRVILLRSRLVFLNQKISNLLHEHACTGVPVIRKRVTELVNRCCTCKRGGVHNLFS